MKLDEEIRNILEAELGDGSASYACLGNYKDTQEDNQDDTPSKQLTILVASGRAKEMIGIKLTQDQVKSASEKDDMRLPYLQKHVMQWLIHFSSFHARL